MCTYVLCTRVSSAGSKRWGGTARGSLRPPPLASPVAMLCFRSVRAPDFAVLTECLNTRGQAARRLGGSPLLADTNSPRIGHFMEPVPRVAGNFLCFILLVFIKEQVAPKTRELQVRPLLRPIRNAEAQIWFCSKRLTYEATAPAPLPRDQMSLCPTFHI